MNDLALFHELKDELAQVKQDNELLREELRKTRNNRNEWASRCRKAEGVTLSTADRTRTMIAHSKQNGFDGSITDECVRIAGVVGLNWKTVRGHWYAKTP